TEETVENTDPDTEDAAENTDEKEENAAEENTEKEEADKEEAKEEIKESEEKPSVPVLTYGRLVSVDKLSKYVKLGDYKGLKLERVVQIVEDSDIDTAIQSYLSQENNKEAASDEVKEGDTVVFDYVGIQNGEELQGASAEGYSMVVSSDNLATDLVGMKKGDTKEVSLPALELETENTDGDAEVLFRVTLRSIYRAPEFTDEWVSANTDYKTMSEYRDYMRTVLEENAKTTADMQIQTTAWTSIVENTNVKEYPEEDVEAAKKVFQDQINLYAEQSGMSLDEFLESQGYDQTTYDTMSQQYAESKVTQNLILQAIVDEEEIDLTDEITRECEDQLVQMYGMSDINQMVEGYGESEVKESVVLYRVLRYIVDEADVTDQIAQGDTVGVDAGSGEDTVEAE
ncbi:MAG: hypothetical protein Q4B26_12455, partial [Eubacteriales bacterium]|nr:hypothetical protein [Eubacteriales bacterium]